jgi:hypothetical protein
MPGALAYAFHESNRGEYLAQYFLSALGVSAPVIRQEDIGVDFFCSLAKEENRKLTFHSPYTVQHGAVGSKDFIYGGYRKETGKWRGDSIEWLFSQELPLFVCVTDLKNASFQLYSTSAMWLVRYKFGREMNLIELCPGAQHDPLEQSRSDKPIGRVEDGGGFGYRIPLGNPVVALTVPDLQTDKRQNAIETLAIAIQIEQTNLTFRRLGVHAAAWCNSVTPNDPKSFGGLGGSVFWNETPGQNVSQQIGSLKNILITLALNLNAQKEYEKLARLAPAFGLYPKDSFDPWILEKLPKTVTDHVV